MDQRKKTQGEYLETNENGKTKYQNLWDAVKAELKEKYTAVNTLKKAWQTNKLTLHLRNQKRKN